MVEVCAVTDGSILGIRALRLNQDNVALNPVPPQKADLWVITVAKQGGRKQPQPSRVF